MRAVAVEGYLDVRGGRRRACAAMLGWGGEGAVVVGIGDGLERAERIRGMHCAWGGWGWSLGRARCSVLVPELSMAVV